MNIHIEKTNRPKIPAMLILGVLLSCIISSPLFAQNSGLTAAQIIDRMEANQTQQTSISQGRMIISDRFGERVSTYQAWSEGSNRFLVEFTSPHERGQKVLRRDDSLFLYYPDARETIRLQGAALRDSLLGSDISYEDMTGNRGLEDNYTFELLGTEEYDGRQCYKIRLTARQANVAYPEQIIWVDSQDFVMRKSEQYARSGRLLKTTRVLATTIAGGYHFPTHMEIVDETRSSSKTEMITEDIQLDVQLPANIFSLEELSW